ncbi:MAG: CheR family methyltransferase [Thermodesulfobacteriota bacterium]
MAKITPIEFKVFTKYIFDICGITLKEGKEYLVETRLSPLLEKHGCVSFSEIYYKAKRDKDLEKEIIDAISTNETFFFRDVTPFEVLQHKILPDLIDRRSAARRPSARIPIRILSLGCSTGQEVYSIAFILRTLGLGTDVYDIRVLGVDISNAAIAKASYGVYSDFELSRGLTPAQINQYFLKLDEGRWKIKDEYRWLATFETYNIFDPSRQLGRFDIIFCRNVGIYFSPIDRIKMYEKIAAMLEPDGYLLIGATESLTYDTDRFIPKKYLRAVFYQPNPAKTG